jgi:hypothetical protein
MKLTHRAKALFSILIAAVTSFVIASPALAAGEGAPEPGPVDVLAILVTGVVVLVIVIVLATVLSNLLGKRG